MMAYPAHQRLTPPDHKKQQDKQHQMFLDEYQNSPRTITLQNHTDSILRGMTTGASTRQQTMMWTAQQRDQLLFRQTSLAKPYLPTTGQLSSTSPSGASSSSRPIRITRRKQNPPRYSAAPQVNDDAHLSASPSELQHFYDEATWRMYHLIQTARSEKQANKAAEASEVEDDDGETHFDRFFQARTPASLLPSTATRVVAEDEMVVNVADKEEGVFELDDL